MAHYFCIPGQLSIAVNLAQWSRPPYHRPADFSCDRCHKRNTLILVTNQMADDATCDK